jgi:hypothetical protein
MDSKENDAVATDEAPVRAAADRGDRDAAVTLALRIYGTELLSFLHAMARDRDLADEAFAEMAEDLLRGLPAFR